MERKIITPLFLSTLLFGCSGGKSEKMIQADIAAFSYLPYPTMDIIVNGIDYGVGSGDVTTDVNLRSGEYFVFWHDAGTGVEHKSINKIVIPTATKQSTMIIHVYPTNDVEAVFTNDWPTETEKGLRFRKNQSNNIYQKR